MKRRLLSTGAMLAIATLTACDARGTDTRTFELEHMSPRDAQALIDPYVPEAEVNMRASERPPAITVSAPAGRLDQIAEMLSRYDVAAPDVRLRFQLIEADGFTDTDPAIADVEAVLRELFRFRGYRLAADAMVAISQQNMSRQRLLAFGDVPLDLTVSVQRISTTADATSIDLHVSLSGHGSDILSTREVVPAGRTVVLGTARPFQDRGALILDVRPEIQ
jgi:hypothetical protein